MRTESESISFLDSRRRQVLMPEKAGGARGMVKGILKKSIAPVLCSSVPVEVWHRILRLDVVLPYYHMVSDTEVEHVSGLYKFRTISQFKADLEFFLRFYKPITIDSLVRHLEGAEELPKRCFLLTFDDGFSQIYDVVGPILHRFGVPAVFFLMTSVIDNPALCVSAKQSLVLRGLSTLKNGPAAQKAEEIAGCRGGSLGEVGNRVRSIRYDERDLLDELAEVLNIDFAGYAASVRPYLTSAQVNDLLKKGFAIGAHSVDHPLYSDLSLKQQLKQTDESISQLTKQFKYHCNTFAFPYRDNGVSAAFFERAFSDGRLKVSFGTAGIQQHFFGRNLERFSMERTDWKARVILGRQYGRALKCRLGGKSMIKPPPPAYIID